MDTFDPYSTTTWRDDLLPSGYEWREININTGEWHLHDDEGRCLTCYLWGRQETLDPKA